MEDARRCVIGEVASWENLRLAAARARRGKSRRADVEAFHVEEERELLRLRRELLAGCYRPGRYRLFEIREPKRRLIAAAPFRDRVVHHALCHVMVPVLERTFIARTFSCRVGKGTTAARECCRRLVNGHRHVMKCDVAKFFPSIDHGVLLERLGERITCPGVMGLIDRILGSFGTGPGVTAAAMPDDEVFAPTELAADIAAPQSRWIVGRLCEAAPAASDMDALQTKSSTFSGRPRGLPIGNLTSQWWGNFMLDRLDHRITDGEGHGAYLRYTDDLLIFGDDKARLWESRDIVAEELAAARLRLAEPKSRLLATREGVPFCGFRFLPGLRPRVLGATKRRFERRRHRLYRAREMAALGVAVFSWYQFGREGNTEGLRRAYATGN